MIDSPKTLYLVRQLDTDVTTLQASFKAAFGTPLFGYCPAVSAGMGAC